MTVIDGLLVIDSDVVFDDDVTLSDRAVVTIIGNPVILCTGSFTAQRGARWLRGLETLIFGPTTDETIDLGQLSYNQVDLVPADNLSLDLPSGFKARLCRIIADGGETIRFQEKCLFEFEKIVWKSSTENRIFLRSMGTADWRLKVTLETDVRYVDVSNSDASLGIPIRAYDSKDSGNNHNWWFEVTTPPGGFSCNVFERLRVVAQPKGGSLITWGLTAGFRAPGPFQFFVDEAEAGSDEWFSVTNDPIVDDCRAYDPQQRYWAQLSNVYYRVRLRTPNDLGPDGKPKEYVSPPQQANGLWSRRDWLLARDIVRKEYLLQNKRTVITYAGVILKRRHWGEPCPKCLEYDTKEVTNVHCPVCFGTGYVGGYFPGVKCRMTFDTGWGHRKQRDDSVGMNDNITKRARAVSYPFMDTGDIFVRLDNGERYVLQKIDVIAEIGGIPIIVSPELRLAPVTDVVYDVPLERRVWSSISSGSSQLAPQTTPAEIIDWRTALNEDW